MKLRKLLKVTYQSLTAGEIQTIQQAGDSSVGGAKAHTSGNTTRAVKPGTAGNNASQLRDAKAQRQTGNTSGLPRGSPGPGAVSSLAASAGPKKKMVPIYDWEKAPEHKSHGPDGADGMASPLSDHRNVIMKEVTVKLTPAEYEELQRRKVARSAMAAGQ